MNIEKKKQSKYNFVVKRDEYLLLYNCQTEKLTVLQPELYLLLRNDDFETLRQKHPIFYDYLCTEGYLVTEDKDEAKSVIDRWKEMDTSEESFSVFVNPTLDCNMKCWYCYERHRPKTPMSHKVQESVLRLLLEKMQNEKLSFVNVGFFGGEPLLEFDGVVMPLLEQVEKMCETNGKKLTISFVTNASLLTSERIERLAKIKVASPIVFQIAIDGDRHFHNLTKKSPLMEDSYTSVINTIKELVSKNMLVTVRLNTTHKNIESYKAVLADFKDVSDEQKSFLRFDIQRVWQDSDKGTNVFLEQQLKLRENLQEENFFVSPEEDPGRCYAERENHVVVNFNGDLFKCTARDFVKENREGVLTDDGKMVWNDKHKERILVMYGNGVCQKCRIFPLCHGFCSQQKLEKNGDAERCQYGYTEKMKIKRIENRVDSLLDSLIINNKYTNEKKVEFS